MKPLRRNYPSTLKGLQEFNRDKAAYNKKVKDAKAGRPLRSNFPSTTEGLKNYQNAFNTYNERTKIKLNALNQGSDQEGLEERVSELKIGKIDPTQFDNRRKKPKIEKAVVKDENSEAFGRMEDVLGPNPNQKLYDFADEVNTNRRELNIADMDKYSNNQMEMYDLPPSSNPNTNVSEMAFRGTDSASFDAVRSKIAKDPSRIQKGLMESGFTADRLANLVIANKKFQANKRKKR